MRIVTALGGNALLRRGEAMTADNQLANIMMAAQALAPLSAGNELVITHGNGPQIGLLALQGAAYDPKATYPLDVLDAETEGMIGYLIEQELGNVLDREDSIVTLLTRIEVDPADPAFDNPDKPIGPVYGKEEADRLVAEKGWRMAEEPRGGSGGYRRVVPSPSPVNILELDVIRLLVDEGVTVICAGGGGIPTVRDQNGYLQGVEAVIDKDRASALLASELEADALLMLTDIEAVMENWGESHARPIRRASPQVLEAFSFAPGSMAPKVQAACDFVALTGGVAGIGCLEDAGTILAGEAGTLITDEDSDILWGD